MTTFRDRLLSKATVNWETGCWEWTASKTHDGYGTISAPGSIKLLAHRAAYELLKGPIPEGLTLDHLCRVRHCINPAHLEPVTSRENTHRSPDTVASRHAATTHCPAGHEYSNSNTYSWRGSRACRTCRNDASRAYRKRRREVQMGAAS